MSELRVQANPRAAARAQPYAAAQALSAGGFAAATREISAWPGYAPTPLVALPALAAALGLAALWYKDERGRFGLKSFKALGGAYAVRRVLARQGLPAKDVTVTCATDGNHGRSVAWGAQLFGCRSVIFIHETVSEGRAQAIRCYGAEVRRVKGNYDDAVRHAAAEAARNGWYVVSDTSYAGYRDVPLDVMHGYGVMAAEIAAQLPAGVVPTHVFVQAGVGALAAAICASFWLRWGARRPRFAVVEPARADCFYRSLEAGRPTAVHGDLDTVMAGLACGEVSQLAWEVLETGADAAVAIGDASALEAVRALALPRGRDPAIVAGETGGAGLAALLALKERPDLRAQLALGADSTLLLFGSEGDTDPEIYRRIVGRSADEVLAA